MVHKNNKIDSYCDVLGKRVGQIYTQATDYTSLIHRFYYIRQSFSLQSGPKRLNGSGSTLYLGSPKWYPVPSDNLVRGIPAFSVATTGAYFLDETCNLYLDATN